MRQKYVIGSVVVGVVQVIDALLALAASGNFNDVSLIPTMIEFLWVIVSLVVLLRKASRFVKALSAVFVTYNVVGWIIGAVKMEELAAGVLPLWMLYASLVFGALFVAASVFVLRVDRLAEK